MCSPGATVPPATRKWSGNTPPVTFSLAAIMSKNAVVSTVLVATVDNGTSAKTKRFLPDELLFASVTVAVKSPLPTKLAVPERTPVFASMLSPVGPEFGSGAIDHLSAPTPPVAVSVAEYGRPCTAWDNDCVVSKMVGSGGGATLPLPPPPPHAASNTSKVSAAIRSASLICDFMPVLLPPCSNLRPMADHPAIQSPRYRRSALQNRSG